MKKSTFTLLLAVLFLMQGFAQQVAQEQRLVITKRTASWCPNCGTWGWTLFKNLLDDNEDKAVLIAAHYSGVLATAAAEEFTDNFGGFYQPRFFVGAVDQNANSGNIASIRTSVKDQVDAAFSLTPVANAGFEPVYRNGAIEVDSKVKFFQPAQGEYYLGIYLIENNVVASQSGVGNNANHMKVFRESFTTSTWGKQIVSGSVNASAEYDLSYSLAIGDPEGYDYEVVGIIWKKENDKYLPVNAWSTDEINTNTTAVKEPAGLLSFAVAPNVTSSVANVQIQLAENRQDASIDVFDVNGKLVANIHRGPLAQGTQSFQVSREMVAGNGVYLVRFSTGNEVSTRKVVFQ